MQVNFGGRPLVFVAHDWPAARKMHGTAFPGVSLSAVAVHDVVAPDRGYLMPLDYYLRERAKEIAGARHVQTLTTTP